ncbi:hypothetical protein IIC45_00600 [Patescibacteria group bacterium]|nr:hypothetical protein [Patescibacteria group bacterium]
MEVLSKLFGSVARVKILRLFLFNPENIFDKKEICRRSKLQPHTVSGEVALFERIGLIKRRSFFKEVEQKRGRRKKMVKKRVQGWVLNDTFLYREPLQLFLLKTATLENNYILRKLRSAGKLKVVIVAGVFIQNWDSRVDLLVVGDSLKKSKLERAIKDIEAEIGMELRYTVFNTKDFKYRLGIHDRLVRDILDYPHQKLLDRLNVL